MQEYSIRKAGDDDIEDVYKIEQESFPNPLSYEGLAHEFRISFSTIIIAEYMGDIVAFAIIWKVHDEIHLNKIAVKNEFRRMGIGKALVSCIIKTINPENAKGILIEVREKDEGAVSFYKSLGFRVTGVRKKYYIHDNAVLMEMNTVDYK